jgi:hypothetical protein
MQSSMTLNKIYTLNKVKSTDEIEYEIKEQMHVKYKLESM